MLVVDVVWDVVSLHGVDGARASECRGRHVWCWR